MSIQIRPARRAAAGAVGAGLLTGALMLGAAPVAPVAASPTESVMLADAFTPSAAPIVLPVRVGVPEVMPMWWHHDHHRWGHRDRGWGHYGGWGHYHHWWNPWHWWWW